MPEPLEPSPAGEAGVHRFLTFRMGDRRYALPAQEVSEVIRVPSVARVPMAPDSLLGVANLRGSVVPVVSLRGLLGRAEADASPTTRAIVLDGAAPVALTVDAVDALTVVEPDRIARNQAELSAEPGERLQGAFRTNAGGGAVKILDVRSLLATVFTQKPRADRQLVQGGDPSPDDRVESADGWRRLVTFDVAGQEYALDLESVREIVPAPESSTMMPRAEALVLGVMAYRDTLLPLLSLRGLLGFGPAADAGGPQKVVVTMLRGVAVGLVADRTRAILAADPALLEPVPPVLAARTGGEARIQAIYRGEGGQRLVSILAPELLFREDVMQRLSADPAAPRGEAAERGEAEGEDRRFVVFRLGEEEFGLPVEAVDEVAGLPEKITRVPKTPTFLEGVVNLRGEVLPIIDQRRRFNMPVLAGGERRRLVIVRADRHRAGLIVDSVVEVLRTSHERIGPAPHLSGEATPLVQGVINLEAAGRMVLVLNPSELLSRAEQGLLDTFEAEAGQGGADQGSPDIEAGQGGS